MATKEKKDKKTIAQEFKAFIARGNVLDMAVGVIIGGAFNAIVTALVSILMSVCTWGVPGGIKGLVTVLPAANNAQRGMDEAIGLGQKFSASELQVLATNLANQNYGAEVVTANPNLIESTKTTILGKYTLHGTTYTYNLSAVIDWGTFINAVISFILVALTLFIIVKVFNSLQEKRKEVKEEVKTKIEGKKAEEAEEPAAE